MAQIRLGELLVKAGHLSADALARALDEQRKWGGRIGRVLREMNLVTEDLLLKALCKQLGLPRADLRAPFVPPGILSKIDPAFAMEHRICPERYDDSTRTLFVAMEDHLNLPALDKISQKTGARVRASLASNTEIAEGLAILYPSHPATQTKPRGTPEAQKNMAMFETKDFSQAAAEIAAEEEKKSSVRFLETQDFAEAARRLREEEEKAPKRKQQMQTFGTEDFTDAAKKVRDED
jgi:hypothetical protein